jgi:hypothetical protein
VAGETTPGNSSKASAFEHANPHVEVLTQRIRRRCQHPCSKACNRGSVHRRSPRLPSIDGACFRPQDLQTTIGHRSAGLGAGQQHYRPCHTISTSVHPTLAEGAWDEATKRCDRDEGTCRDIVRGVATCSSRPAALSRARMSMSASGGISSNSTCAGPAPSSSVPLGGNTQMPWLYGSGAEDAGRLTVCVVASVESLLPCYPMPRRRASERGTAGADGWRTTPSFSTSTRASG